MAIVDYTTAIGIDPDDALAYNCRGLAYEAKGEPELAAADFEAARLITLHGSN